MPWQHRSEMPTEVPPSLEAASLCSDSASLPHTSSYYLHKGPSHWRLGPPPSSEPPPFPYRVSPSARKTALPECLQSAARPCSPTSSRSGYTSLASSLYEAASSP